MLIQQNGELKGKVIKLPELDIVYEDLTEEQQAVFDCIGEDAFAKLVLLIDGDSIYVPKVVSVSRSKRDENIRNDFNGYNFKFLSNKYGLTPRTIRSIVAGIREEKQNEPFEGQLTFDEIK